MTNRMKHLLAMYNANRGPISTIASARIDESGSYEKLFKQRLTGRDFARKKRAAEMSLGTDQSAARLIVHHTKVAAENLAAFPEQLEDPFLTQQHRCKNIRNLPEHLLDRLQPVFSRNDLFDTEGNFQMRFYTWHQSYIGQLDQANAVTGSGKGRYSRLLAAYQAVFSAEQPIVEDLISELIALMTPPSQSVHQNSK